MKNAKISKQKKITVTTVKQSASKLTLGGTGIAIEIFDQNFGKYG